MGCGVSIDAFVDKLGAFDRRHHLFLYAAYLIVESRSSETINLVLLFTGIGYLLNVLSQAAAPYLLFGSFGAGLAKDDLPFLCLSLVLALGVGIYVRYSEAVGKTFSN